MKIRSELTSIPMNSTYQDGLCTEVAIVGAGAAGLYSAWRLVADGDLPGSQVQLFEMDDRIGGRLESVTLPGMDVVGELGGMRYMPSQAIISTLIEQVFSHALESVPFPMGDNAHLFAFLRKQYLRADAWTRAQARGDRQLTRYMLNEADIGYSADQLFNKVVYDVLTADPWFTARYADKVKHYGPYDYTFELTADDWSRIKPQLRYCFAGPYQDALVSELGFWNMLKDRVGQEGYTFLADAGGYYSNTINWNAAEALPYMVGDFSNAGTEYRTIAGGYDGIAYALADAYLAEPGACIWRENQLLGFTRSSKPGYRYTLHFLNRPGRAPWAVHANSIVLAMPRRALELLAQDSFFFRNEELQRNLASVIPEPSYKILMGFEQPWWQQSFGASAGHSITDLPLRQCYYFGADPSNSHSLLLGSYNDMRTTPFWRVLARHPEPFKPRATALVAPAQLEGLQNVQASQRMVNEVMKELRELHGSGVSVPAPYVTWYKDWSADPYGGGYHAWQAGYAVDRVMPFMRKPDRAEAIHIVGESYSDQQGWVEGAFCVAERMLEEHFGLRRPLWLDPRYHLGY
ncbi:flavin monoamine oxidase family protein [Pseudoduganella sp. UC29_71]|uniref:flavin monoamine oxidase family protein n=1 Tax=Pseudoduganella sp. UC29_71 TaxID=3350174 RepID=UPI003670220D